MRRQHGEGKGKKIFGIILIITMFGSVFTFIFFGFSSGRSVSSGVVDYNGFELINRGTYWSTTIDGREALFTYLPDDLGFIFVNNAKKTQSSPIGYQFSLFQICPLFCTSLFHLQRIVYPQETH